MDVICDEKKEDVEGMYQGSSEKRKVKLKYLLRYLRDYMNQRTVPQIDALLHLPSLTCRTCQLVLDRGGYQLGLSSYGKIDTSIHHQCT